MRRDDESYQHLFLDSQNQLNLAQYIISHSTEAQSPDIDLVGPVVCDCFNVGLVIMEVNSESKPSKVFSPSKEKAKEWAKDTMMYIHLLKDGDYWDHLYEDKGGTMSIPKHIIHTMLELEQAQGQENSSESFRMALGSVYQVRVYDATLRRNVKVGDMIAPEAESPHRVHYLEIDCSNVENHWVFTLWRPQMAKPGVPLASRPVWIYAKFGDEARCISVWKQDITNPRFLLDRRETMIYVVEADNQEEASECIRIQFLIRVAPI